LAEDVKFYFGDVQLPLIVPMLYFVVVTLLVAVPLITKPKESAIGLAMMLGTGVVYYLLVITWTSKPAALGTLIGTSRSIDYDDIFFTICTIYNGYNSLHNYWIIMSCTPLC